MLSKCRGTKKKSQFFFNYITKSCVSLSPILLSLTMIFDPGGKQETRQHVNRSEAKKKQNEQCSPLTQDEGYDDLL